MAGVQDLPQNQQRAALLQGIPEEIRGLAYFYPGFANSVEACKYLEPRAADAGYFLLRLSSLGNNYLSLSISVKRMKVRHMTVNMERTPYLRYFINNTIKFDSFEDLRKHYSEYSIRNAENLPNVKLLVPLHRGYRDLEEYMRLNPNFRYSNGIPIPGTRPDDDNMMDPWTPEENFSETRIVELRRKRDSVYANRPLPKPPNDGRRLRPIERASTITRRSVDRPKVEPKRHSTNTSASLPKDMSLLRNFKKRSSFLGLLSSRQDEPKDKRRTMQVSGTGIGRDTGSGAGGGSVLGATIGSGVAVGQGAPVVPGAVVGSGVAVGQGAPVVPGAVVGSGVAVGQGAPVVPGAVVGSAVAVGQGAPVVPGAGVGSGVAVGPGEMVGQGATIGSGAPVGSGSVACPKSTGVGARPKSSIVLRATNPFSFFRKLRTKASAKGHARSAISMDNNSAANEEGNSVTSGEANNSQMNVATSLTNNAAKIPSKSDEMSTSNTDVNSAKTNVISPSKDVSISTTTRGTRSSMKLGTKTLTKVEEIRTMDEVSQETASAKSTTEINAKFPVKMNERNQESPSEDDNKHATPSQLHHSEDRKDDDIFEIEDIVTEMSACNVPNEEDESKKSDRAEAPAREPPATSQQPEDDKSESPNTKTSKDVLATVSLTTNQIRRVSVTDVDDYTKPQKTTKRYSLRPPCPAPTTADSTDTYYSKPMDESENKIDELKQALNDQEYCDCGILMGASKLPRNWTLHRSLYAETYKWLFYQNDEGVTTWDLPSEIIPEITYHQFNVIAKLSADCHLAPPEELSCRFPEGYSNAQRDPPPLNEIPSPTEEVVSKKKKSQSGFSLWRGLSLSVK